MIGSVTSNKMTKVVAVTVEQIKIHPLYKKRLKRSNKFLARTMEKLNLGDLVEIKETKPLSRRVRFMVTRVIVRADVLPEVKEEKADKVKVAPVKKEKVVSKEATKEKAEKAEVKK